MSFRNITKTTKVKSTHSKVISKKVERTDTNSLFIESSEYLSAVEISAINLEKDDKIQSESPAYDSIVLSSFKSAPEDIAYEKENVYDNANTSSINSNYNTNTTSSLSQPVNNKSNDEKSENISGNTESSWVASTSTNESASQLFDNMSLTDKCSQNTLQNSQKNSKIFNTKKIQSTIPKNDINDSSIHNRIVSSCTRSKIDLGTKSKKEKRLHKLKKKAKLSKKHLKKKENEHNTDDVTNLFDDSLFEDEIELENLFEAPTTYSQTPSNVSILQKIEDSKTVHAPISPVTQSLDLSRPISLRASDYDDFSKTKSLLMQSPSTILSNSSIDSGDEVPATPL